MQEKIVRVIVATISTIMMIVVSTTNVMPKNYRGLIINKIRFDFGVVVPGQVIEDEFIVTHDFQDETRSFDLLHKNYDIAVETDGKTPKILPFGSVARTASLASWIQIDKPYYKMTKYGDEVAVKFKITVPVDAEPGSKMAVITVSDGDASAPDNSTGVGLTKELGPQVLLTVAGETKKGFYPEDFYLTDIDSKRKNFFFHPPVTFNVLMNNKGNVYSQPSGVIYLFHGNYPLNLHGYIESFNVNENKNYLIANSSRNFQNEWADSFLLDQYVDIDGRSVKSIKIDWDKLSKLRIGKYTAVLVMETLDPETGKSSTMQKDLVFWIIPWYFILFVIIVLSIALISYLAYKSKKIYDKFNADKKKKATMQKVQNLKV